MLDLTDVIFRAEKSGPHKGEVTAVFPALPGCNEYDVCCYTHIGQHSAASRDWYRTTRQAMPEEYADLKRELENLWPEPYRLRIVHRWTQRHDKTRRDIIAEV